MMPKRHYVVENILLMIGYEKYTKADILDALEDLEEMRESITKNTYINVRALLESKI